MAQPFLVTRDMLVRLCESVLDGVVPPEALEDIGFALITSDAFHWDETDDQLAETLYDWSSPEINYPLTLENVQMFRNRLGQHPGS